MSALFQKSLSVLAVTTLLGTAAWAQTPQTPVVPAPPSDAAPAGPMAHGPRHGAPGLRAGSGEHRGPQHRGPRAGGPMMMLLGPGLDRALDLVQATPQQRSEIRRIAGAARDDLRAARREGQPRREAWMAAWTADRVDVGAMEAERARVALKRDAAGKRMVQAMADIGAVLRPEQRRMLAEQWNRRGGQRRAELMDGDEFAQAAAD